MIFVFDVGNTNTVLGVFDRGELQYEWRIGTDRHKTEDEFAMIIKQLFEHDGLAFEQVHGIIISSVVPPIMYALERMCRNYFQLEPLVVGNGSVETGLNMIYPNPNEIGADRIVNAVGAIKEYDTPLIIIDFGTATTYCYIDEERQYVGGAIAPGVNISTEALYAKAAKLPRVELVAPKNVVGSSTVEAMQMGIFYGYVGQVDEVVRRMKEQSSMPPTVVATGGLAPLFAEESRTIDVVDPYLTLKGLYEIYKRNEGKCVNKGE
ncbi:type III pantothenate kinase [Pontibacillus litoralis]|uniref:Type III pantothenate kinase n=1 Tax=Pontibacillus litoralis JSM 072002 TaxID=1385512 RepID=A0A0A5HPI4_9BACI|nr:type III pantothenate kinase [Pontibacillus litoralis]KGX85497.1 pantothenate kinase [Pontibacillus litoralis JSM 072002]